MSQKAEVQLSKQTDRDRDDDFENVGKMSKCKELAYQIGMLTLCYTAWMFVHMQREFWAMSKEVIIEENADLPTTFFGWVNTCLFLTYGFCQFGTGAIGDAFPKKYILALSFTI